jgi:2-oxoglutarate ferredoxin oxidoreductase subunit alpha
VRARGHLVDHAHLVNLNPFPADLGAVLARYKKVLVPEVNLGQLSRLLRAEYLVDAISFTQVQGVPFRAAAMESAILQQIDGTAERYAVLEDLPTGDSGTPASGSTASGSTDTKAQS